MARGRCQTGAEAFAGPWEKSDASRPIAREPSRVRERDDPYVALVPDEDAGVRRLLPRFECDHGKPRDLSLTTASTRRRISADQASS
jgi:hypothetical protein